MLLKTITDYLAQALTPSDQFVGIDAVHHHDEGAENMITVTMSSGEAFVIVVAQQR